MNYRYLLYAKRLELIVEQISNVFKKCSFNPANLEGKNEEELKLICSIYLESIDGFRLSKTKLANTISPSIVRKEHKDLINAVQMFVDGTEKMFKSIDIDNCTIKNELMQLGVLEQQVGVKKAIKTVNKITDKII